MNNYLQVIWFAFHSFGFQQKFASTSDALRATYAANVNPTDDIFER